MCNGILTQNLASFKECEICTMNVVFCFLYSSSSPNVILPVRFWLYAAQNDKIYKDKIAKCWKIWIHMGKHGQTVQYGSCQHHLPEDCVKVWCPESSILSNGRRRRIQNHLHSCNPMFPIRSLNNVVLPNMTQSLTPTPMLYQWLLYYITQENIINFFCISQQIFWIISWIMLWARQKFLLLQRNC